MDQEAIIESNKKAFEKEIGFAMDLTDRIPMHRIDQDLRSKNRFWEHSREGHSLTDSGRQSHHQPNHTLFNCTCGWVGWLIPKDETNGSKS